MSHALSSDELAAAATGYRFFGLDDVASLLEHSVNATEDEVDQAHTGYRALIPSDQTIVIASKLLIAHRRRPLRQLSECPFGA